MNPINSTIEMSNTNNVTIDTFFDRNSAIHDSNVIDIKAENNHIVVNINQLFGDSKTTRIDNNNNDNDSKKNNNSNNNDNDKAIANNKNDNNNKFKPKKNALKEKLSKRVFE